MSKLTIQAKLTIIDQDSIGKYLQELRIDKSTIPLSKEDEVKLFNQYKMTGDLRIKERITKANLRWVVSVAKQYSYPKIKLEDLINEGNIGMIEAIDKFDVSRGTSFVTFATDYIRLAIRSYINDIAKDIPQPGNRNVINKLVKRATFDLKLLGYENPTDEQIVEQYMLIKKSVDPKLNTVLLNEIRNNSKEFVSMHTTISDLEDSLELCDTFKSSQEWTADFEMCQNETKKLLMQCLNNLLSEREVEIVCMSFGLIDNEPLTHDQIGARLGFTRERIGQILNKAVNKLKKEKSIIGQLLGTSKETIHSNESNHIYYAMKTL